MVPVGEFLEETAGPRGQGPSNKCSLRAASLARSASNPLLSARSRPRWLSEHRNPQWQQPRSAARRRSTPEVGDRILALVRRGSHRETACATVGISSERCGAGSSEQSRAAPTAPATSASPRRWTRPRPRPKPSHSRRSSTQAKRTGELSRGSSSGAGPSAGTKARSREEGRVQVGDPLGSHRTPARTRGHDPQRRSQQWK